MKVAKDSLVQLDGSAGMGLGAANGARAYIARKRANSDERHDPRGLIVAVLLCAACWATLGYFLLAR